MGGHITGSRESGVKEEMTGEARSCLVWRVLFRAECGGSPLPELPGPRIYLNCLVSERVRNLVFSHPVTGAPAWVSTWAHRDSNRKWKARRDWDLEDGRLRGCTDCPEISEGPEPFPWTLTCNGHGLPHGEPGQGEG